MRYRKLPIMGWDLNFRHFLESSPWDMKTNLKIIRFIWSNVVMIYIRDAGKRGVFVDIGDLYKNQ